jgi:putative endonuclease
MIEQQGYVYILANRKRGTLYVGVTSALNQRLAQHSDYEGNSFVKRYHLNHLVYIEEYSSIVDAITREKQLKNWHRQWKINLIEQFNPKWKNLLDS